MWVGKMSGLATAVSSIFWKMYLNTFLKLCNTSWYHNICAQRDHHLPGKSGYEVFKQLSLAAAKENISL